MHVPLVLNHFEILNYPEEVLVYVVLIGEHALQKVNSVKTLLHDPHFVILGPYETPVLAREEMLREFEALQRMEIRKHVHSGLYEVYVTMPRGKCYSYCPSNVKGATDYIVFRLHEQLFVPPTTGVDHEKPPFSRDPRHSFVRWNGDSDGSKRDVH